MKNLKKPLALLLAAVLMLGTLAGCGGNGDGNGTAEGDEYVYTAEYRNVTFGDAKISYINYSCYANGRIYFMGEVEDGMETESYPVYDENGEPLLDENGEPVMESYEYMSTKTGLFSLAEDGTDFKEHSGYEPTVIPEGMSGSSNVGYMVADAEGSVWIYEETYIYSYGDGGGITPRVDVAVGIAMPMPTSAPGDGGSVDYSNKYMLHKLDENGAKAISIDLSEVFADSEYVYVSGLQVTGDGNIVIVDGSTDIVYVFDASGAKLFELASNGWINSLTRLKDGSVAALSYNDTEGKYELKAVDVAAKAWGESKPAPANAWTLYAGGGDYDFYYDMSSNFAGYDVESGTSTTLFNWINCDINSNYVNSVIPLADGRIMCFYRDWEENEGATQLIYLTKVLASTLPEKTTLTYACMYVDYDLRRQIIKFNRSSDKYRIEVLDYSEYNTEDDYNAGLTKLTTEILSGKVPDLMSADNLPIGQYGAKGLLEDLWKYIEADEALGGREGVVESVFNAYSSDGKLYQVFSGFQLMTVAALKDAVGDITSWTVADVLAALEQLPEGARLMSEGITKDTFLFYICYLNLDKFVDWETGEVSFDSQTFIDLLSLTELLPSEYDWDAYYSSGNYRYTPENTALKNGEQLMMLTSLYSLSDYVYTLGVDPSIYSFPGFPTADGTSGNTFSTYGGLAMSSKCADKEGAWQFIRTLLTEEYQNEYVYQFPTNQKVLDEKFDYITTVEYETDEMGNFILDENGEKITVKKIWGWDEETGSSIQLEAMDEATAELFRRLINETTDTMSYDENLMGIVTEECAAYFAGQKSAEDTANMIQSRVSLYVNEQR